MKKVLVIGSNSFSGSDFIDLLLSTQKYKVFGISRSEEKADVFLSYKKNPHLINFEFFQIDLNRDLEKLEKILEEIRPEYIVNFAAQSEVAPSWIYPEHWYITNVVSLTKLVNLLKEKKWLEKYVHISSPEVYGTCTGIVKENAPFNPTTPYAASKAAGDLSLFTFYKNFNFPLVMIRATNVYGPHQQLFKIIPRSHIYLKKGKKIELHGGGKAIKSYIFIRDVSKGELLAMEKGEIGQIYHLSPDGGVSVRDVVSSICKNVGKNFDEATCIVSERLGQDKSYVIDSTKARKELGWVPTYTLKEGLKLTSDWIEKYYEEIQKLPLDYIHKP